MLNKLNCHVPSNFQSINLLDPDCCYKFAYLMANSADPDQLASDLDLHCLQMQDISGFSRTRVKLLLNVYLYKLIILTLSMLGKNSADDMLKYFFFFFPSK